MCMLKEEWLKTFKTLFDFMIEQQERQMSGK